MRIATSQIFASNLSSMENQEAQLLKVEQQISSGVSLTNPADNPVGAAQAVQLSATSATLTQYSTNQTSALTSLKIEDSTLSSVTTTLQSVNSAIQEAMGATLNDTNRASLSKELEGYRNELLSLANTTDGAGNALFAGFKNTSQVFSDQPGTGVTYNGDSGQRLVQVTDTRQIPIGDSGSSVFMSVQALGSQQVPSGAANNTGTGVIGGVTVTNPAATSNNDNYTISFTPGPASPANTGTGTLGAVSVTNDTVATNNDNYSISFSNIAGVLSYTVTDNSIAATPPATGGTVTATGAYTAGAAIPLGAGMTTSVSGAPAAGDTFAASQAGGSMYYTVTDTTNAAVLPTTGLYTDGGTITVGNGLSTTISGSPAATDTFSVTPASNTANTNVFATLDSLIKALNNPAQDNATATATMTNALSTGLAQISNTMANVTTIQASVGGREQELAALQTVTSTNSMQTTSNLNDLTSTDTVAAISKFTQYQAALTASQKTFSASQNLSLFQYINP